jgi:hypothetical protein
LLLNPILTLIDFENFSEINEILILLGFDPITANFRPNDYYYDGISGYSIERGCDHWVRFEKRLIILQLFL